MANKNPPPFCLPYAVYLSAYAAWADDEVTEIFVHLVDRDLIVIFCVSDPIIGLGMREGVEKDKLQRQMVDVFGQYAPEVHLLYTTTEDAAWYMRDKATRLRMVDVPAFLEAARPYHLNIGMLLDWSKEHPSDTCMKTPSWNGARNADNIRFFQRWLPNCKAIGDPVNVRPTWRPPGKDENCWECSMFDCQLNARCVASGWRRAAVSSADQARYPNTES